jgi:RHH-type transcriptional regulator, rel operon repressor / antitoxin RelB
MTTIRLPSDIETRLSALATLTSRPKSFYIREAIKQYLEDMEDGYLALERIANPKRTLLETDALLKKLEDNV